MTASIIRTAYSRHVLKAHREGFEPMTLRQYVGFVAFCVRNPV